MFCLLLNAINAATFTGNLNLSRHIFFKTGTKLLHEMECGKNDDIESSLRKQLKVQSPKGFLYIIF